MSAIALKVDARTLSQRVSDLKKSWNATERRRRAEEGQRRMQSLLGMLGLDNASSKSLRTA